MHTKIGYVYRNCVLEIDAVISVGQYISRELWTTTYSRTADNRLQTFFGPCNNFTYLLVAPKGKNCR